jgi:hypothetical protein
MIKQAHQQVPTPTSPTDSVNKKFIEDLNRQTASGDYLTARNTVQQDNVAVFDPMDVSTVLTSRGELSLVANQVTGLKAGRTYWCTAQFRVNTSGDSMEYRWRTVAGSVQGGSWGSSTAANAASGFGDQPSAVFVFTPDVDTDLEVVVTYVSDTDVDVFSGHIAVVEIGATVTNSTGGLEYMDTIEVTADQTSVSFGVAGDGQLQRALDGDVDEEYEVSYYFPPPGASTVLTLQPNGISSDQIGARGFSGASTNGQVNAFWGLAQPNSSDECYGTAWVRAQTGNNRMYRGVESMIGPGNSHAIMNAGQWAETATNITSLVINASVASTIKIGSRFVLYRRTSTSVRADSAGIYERNIEATVSQGTNGVTTYTTGHATFGGSAVGVSVSLVDDTVSTGSVTVDFKIGGATVLTTTLDSTNTSFHRAAAPVGFNTVAPGDAIEVDISTTSLVTAGAGTPAIIINTTLTNEAFIQAPTGPDYMIASLSAEQNPITTGDHLEFDSESSRGPSIALATGAGQANGLFTLQPGKTYEIHCNIGAECNEGNAVISWYDDAGDTLVVDDTGNDVGFMWFRDNAAHDNVVHPSQTIVLTPSVEITIKLEVVADLNITAIYTGTRVFIKELK